jgi:23S rRNA (guanine745-N1)-methyltransferase
LVEAHLAALPAGGGDGAAPLVVDAGCGEGYYLGRLAGRPVVAVSYSRPVWVGIDIARDAVDLAARRYPAARFAVADITRRLPFHASAVQALLDVCAPRSEAEFSRVLAPNGLLVVAIPGERHLWELRQTLPMIGIEPEKERRLAERLGGAFQQTERTELVYEITLDGAAAADLVAMTPSRRHLPPDFAAGLPQVTDTRVTVAFVVLAFLRT